MIVHFELTRKEHGEALAAVADSQSREKPTPWFYIVLPLGLIQGVGLAVMGNVLAIPPQALLFNALVPSLSLLLAGMVGLTAVQIRTGRGLSWRMILAMAALFLVIAEVFLGRLLFSPPPGTVETESTGEYFLRMLFPHLTWILASIGVAVAIVWARGRRSRLEWEGQPTIRLPKTVDITANIVEVSDSTMRCQYSWASFVKFEKTKNLFLLYLSPSRPVIIPRRAFANSDEVEALCAMAEAISPQRGHGFPVGLAGPPPLPVSRV